MLISAGWPSAVHRRVLSRLMGAEGLGGDVATRVAVRRGQHNHIKAHQYLRKLRVGVRISESIAASNNAIAMKGATRNIQNHAAESARSGRVVTTVKSEQELANLEDWEQGDETMYTAENVERRLKLRRDRRVLAALQMWWDTAQRSRGITDPFVETTRAPRRPVPRRRGGSTWTRRGTTRVYTLDYVYVRWG